MLGPLRTLTCGRVDYVVIVLSRSVRLCVWTALILIVLPRLNISLVWTDLTTVGALFLLWRIGLLRHIRLSGPMQVIALLFMILGMEPASRL